MARPRHERCLPALATTEEATVRRRYRGDNLVLETTFECSQGVVAGLDFMPLRDGASDLVRIVTGQSGEVSLRSELALALSKAESWSRP